MMDLTEGREYFTILNPQPSAEIIQVRKMRSSKSSFRRISFLIAFGFAHMSAALDARAAANAVQAIEKFGRFIPDLSDPETQGTNSRTINSAIISIGMEGGGTLLLPAGTFHIGLDQNAKKARAISIGYDNITIAGAGMEKTILKTNGEWNSDLKRRGHGIVIDGTTEGAPRSNITLKDFQLDGQSGWSGKYKWPAEPATGDGWDTTHKGIAMIDTQVNNVSLENLYVHRFKGEILYTGGLRVGKVTVRGCKLADTNGSCLNLYGADLLVQDTLFLGPTRFWVELTARANQGGYPTNRSVFRNNTFRDAVGAIGFAIGSCGDGTSHEVIVESNNFSDAPNGVFLWGGGAAGPYVIRDNIFKNIGGIFDESRGALMDFEYGGGLKDGVRNFNKNITFVNNKIENAYGPLITLSGSWASGVHNTPGYEEIENVLIEGNRFEWKDTDTNQNRAIIEYGSIPSWVDNGMTRYLLRDIVIRNNEFANGTNPTQVGMIESGDRPKFNGNTYSNLKFTPGSGVFNLTKENPKIAPVFDKAQVYTNSDLVVAIMQTDQYSDGTEVEIIGGTKDAKVMFSLDSESYKVKEERILDGQSSLKLIFDLNAKKWVEKDFRIFPATPAARLSQGDQESS